MATAQTNMDNSNSYATLDISSFSSRVLPGSTYLTTTASTSRSIINSKHFKKN